MITVRPIAAGEGALLHAMIRSLADSHGQLDHLEATPRMLEAALAEPHGVVGCLIAEADGAPAGYAFWHRSFSTFRGRSTIHLEDIAVLPDFQRHGIGRALMRAMAALAVREGYASISWMMMGWNDKARAFYEDLGADIEPGMAQCRLSGAALARAAGK